MMKKTVFVLLILAVSAFAGLTLRDVGRIDMGPMGAVASEGQVVYAGMGGALNIYNIYHKDFPQLISTIDDRSSNVKAIAVEDDILWVLWEREGLHAFDITDRYSPRLISELTPEADERIQRFTAMDIDGDIAFVAGADFVASVDIFDPDRPEIINFATLNGAPLRIDYHENKLYLAAGNLGLAALFLPQPNEFFLMGVQEGIYTTVKAYGTSVVYGRLDEPRPGEQKLFREQLFSMPFRSPMVVDVRDDHLFAGGLENFAVYRIPERAGEDPKMIWDLPFLPTVDLALHDDVIYLANSHKGLSVFDIRNPYSPREIGSFATHDFPRRATIHNGLLYVAAGVSGALVFDVGNPAFPRLLDTLASDLYELVWDVAVEGEFVYVLGARDDISENVFVAQFREDGRFMAEYPIARVSALDPIGEMAFDGKRMAVSLGTGGIAVCDYLDGRISPRYHITDRSLQFSDLAFVGENLIASDFHGGYHIFALDRGIPPTIGHIKTSEEGGNGIAVRGDYLLSADGPAGLAVINISDPTRPFLADRYITTWGSDVTLHGDYAFLADGQGALKVFDISKLPDIRLVAELADGGYWTGAAIEDNFLFGIDRFAGIHIIEILQAELAKAPAEKPAEVAVIDAFPNPFNARATITIDLPERADVDLSIYDISGRKVTTIIRDDLPRGRYNLTWRADDEPSGTYFAVLRTGGTELRKKLLLVK
ncbi:MAG TPA: T9SS type A sorting domain-containing protein [candidate division Zixibacteria bacterium]|nr:T9SS type A sorting domain-containing protein [candidate division Zixibacteria bacterium]